MPGAIVLDEKGRPQVTDTCTGCGLCEFYCPTEPASIRVRPQSAR
jgi:NAD-dependent dihydropyrimidine dehydrogenase PreA subunit